MSTLTNALAKAGIEAAEVEIVKNGIVCTGYQIDNGTNVKPVIYFSEEETVEAFVERALDASKLPAPEIDGEDIISRERLLQNTILCVQKQGTESIVKKEYLNLELYLRVEVDMIDDGTKGSIKITPQILEKAGLSSEELFAAAKSNSIKKASVRTMAEVIGMPEELFGETPFYVATYDGMCHGAGIIALSEVLHKFCESKAYKGLLILPSSTEEILLLPDITEDVTSLAEMVNQVNTETVDAVLQLEPVVYRYDDATRKVSIASSFREEV